MQLLMRSALSRGTASARGSATLLAGSGQQPSAGRRAAGATLALPFAARGLQVTARAGGASAPVAPPAAPGLKTGRSLGGGGLRGQPRRGLRTSSVVTHGLKAGIVGLPNVGKVRQKEERGGGGGGQCPAWSCSRVNVRGVRATKLADGH